MNLLRARCSTCGDDLAAGGLTFAPGAGVLCHACHVAPPLASGGA